jgi:hypothetical protein
MFDILYYTVINNIWGIGVVLSKYRVNGLHKSVSYSAFFP